MLFLCYDEELSIDSTSPLKAHKAKTSYYLTLLL